MPKDPVDRAIDLIRTKNLSRRAAAQETGANLDAVYREARRLELPATDRRGRKRNAKQTPTMELPPEEIPVFIRDYRHLDRLHVFPLGDVHMGSANFQQDKWDEWCGYVADHDHCSMLGVGDFLNVALPDSVSDSFTEVLTVPKAKRRMRESLRPIADAGRLDLLIPGNHEARITKRTGDCPIEDIAEALKVNYARPVALLVYQVGDQEYEVFVRHGSGSGRAGAQATRMEREAQTMIADVYVTGHTHRQQVLRGAVFQRIADRVLRRRQVYVSGGSFLSYEEYAGTAGLSPADIGCPRIRLDGTRKDVHASI